MIMAVVNPMPLVLIPLVVPTGQAVIDDGRAERGQLRAGLTGGRAGKADNVDVRRLRGPRNRGRVGPWPEGVRVKVAQP